MAKPRSGPPLTYAAAGVDIDAQDRALAAVRRLARSTFSPGVLTEIGSFGGMFTLEPENPRGTERVAAVLVPSGTYAGGTHLLIQTYLDRQAEWNALTIEDQEGVIGRTKFDDIEIPDAQKKP